MIAALGKAALAVVVLGALCVIAGLSGLMFQAWPTGLNDETLPVDAKTLARLAALKAERKFDADGKTFYPGAPSEAVRARAQAAVDRVIASLIAELPESPRRSQVLRTFKTALNRFSADDSEERDQFLVYLERIMAILGVRDSGELLNVWRYGFPYGWFFKRQAS